MKYPEKKQAKIRKDINISVDKLIKSLLKLEPISARFTLLYIIRELANLS